MGKEKIGELKILRPVRELTRKRGPRTGQLHRIIHQKPISVIPGLPAGWQAESRNLISSLAGLDPGACPGLDPGFAGVTGRGIFGDPRKIDKTLSMFI